MAAALVVIFAAMLGQAQVTNTNNDQANPVPGVPHDYIGLLNETVNPANGSLSLRIGVKQKQMPTPQVPFHIDYDSNGASILRLAEFPPPTFEVVPSDGLMTTGGWTYAGPMLSYRRTVVSKQVRDQPLTYKNCYYATDYVFVDPSGGRHSLGLMWVYPDTVAGSDCTKPDFNIDYSQKYQSILSGGDTFYKVNYDQQSHNWIITGADGTRFEAGQDQEVAIGDPSPPTVPDPNRVWSKTIYWPALNAVDRNGNGIMSNWPTTTGMGVDGYPVGSSNIRHISTGVTNDYLVTWERKGFNAPAVPSTQSPNNNRSNCASDLGVAIPSQQAVITDIALPNGGHYQINYDPTFGTVNKITYPNGGWVKYTWDWNTDPITHNNPEYITYASGNVVSDNLPVPDCGYFYAMPAIATRTVSFDGVHSALFQKFAYFTTRVGNNTGWSSKQTIVTTTDLRRANTDDPTNVAPSSKVIYSYEPKSAAGSPPEMLAGGQVPYESTITYQDGSGATLKTVNKQWWGGDIPYLVTCEDETLANGPSHATTYAYGDGGVMTDKKEYGDGSSCSSLGTPVRETVIHYQAFANTAILDRPQKQEIKNGSGTTIALTDYTDYDERGNVGKITKTCLGTNCGSSPATLVTTFTYNSRGQVLTTVDPNGNASGGSPAQHTTTQGYDSNGYLQSITQPSVNGIAQQRTFLYNSTTGLVTSSKDVNNNAETTYEYVDLLNRLTKINFPDGGFTSFAYDDGVYNSTTELPKVTTTKKIDNSKNSVTITAYDGMGQAIRTKVMTTPTVLTDTTYDGEGRVWKATNPYETTGDTTYGVTEYTYDALGRVTDIKRQDGATVHTDYSGNCTTVTDEAGKQRRSCTDGLGRLVRVEEPGKTQ